MASFKTSGLDDLFDDLDELSNVEGNHGLFEVVNSSFISNHTEYSDLISYLGAGGFPISCEDDIENIDLDSLDAYVRGTTKFKGWNDLFSAASDVFIDRLL